MNYFVFRKIAIYGVGALVGGGVGYLIADHLLTREENKKLSEEMGEITGFYKSEGLEKTPPVPEKQEWVPEVQTGKKKKGKGKGKPQTDYTKFANKRTPEEEVKARIVNEEREPDNNKPIVVITLEQHSLDTSNREKRVLTYYEGDGEVCDENEDILPAPEDFIGDALEHFGEGSGDPDTVYVRNNLTGVNYEIVRNKDSYAHAVLGQTPEPPKRGVRRARRTRKTTDEEED